LGNLLLFWGFGHLGKDLIPEGFNIILLLASSLAMPIRVFVEAGPASHLLYLTLDHCRNIMTQEQSTTGAVIVYQITDADRISLHLSLHS
jgi:hypothetical protein